MAAFNYQDSVLRFDEPLFVYQKFDYFDEVEEDIIDNAVDKVMTEPKTRTVHKLEYTRIKYHFDFTLLLYPLQLVASNRFLHNDLLHLKSKEIKGNKTWT
jgi:hypothetical protein